MREHRKEKDEQVVKDEEQSKSKDAFGGKVSKYPTACNRVLDKAIVAKRLKQLPVAHYRVPILSLL